ncbi:MAG: universal stress protein, partial [Ilumatobacteraceae bacterium]|nr:universal stress protein [Ilumatobacteraceae bacterium]
MTASIYEVEAEFFKTIAHPARIRVLELLRDGERSVSELIPDGGLEPSHLSQQLGVLRRANVITGWSSDSISRAPIRGLYARPPTSPGHRHHHAVTYLVAREAPWSRGPWTLLCRGCEAHDYDMTTKIIVGVDGSDPSMEALRWAAYEARRRNADIRVVSCYTVPGYGSSTVAVYPIAIDIETLEEGGNAVVGRALEVVEAIDPKLVVDGTAEMCAAVSGVIEAAESDDEIVVGATGHAGFLDGLLGSVTTGVIHRAHVPVIVVPSKPPAEVGDTMKKIVVGVDGSPGSLHALDWAY